MNECVVRAGTSAHSAISGIWLTGRQTTRLGARDFALQRLAQNHTMSDSESAASSSRSPSPAPKQSKSKAKDAHGKNEGTDPTWEFQPPPGRFLLEDSFDAGEFDWDNVNNNEDLELVVIRVPNGVRPTLPVSDEACIDGMQG